MIPGSLYNKLIELGSRQVLQIDRICIHSPRKVCKLNPLVLSTFLEFIIGGSIDCDRNIFCIRFPGQLHRIVIRHGLQIINIGFADKRNAVLLPTNSLRDFKPYITANRRSNIRNS